MKIKYTELFIFIVSAELVGALSALITGDFAGFFDRYASPLLMPPAWLFPVVWAVLYALMGISAYLIYFYDGSADKKNCNAAKYKQNGTHQIHILTLHDLNKIL